MDFALGKITETGGDDRVPAAAKESLLALRDQLVLVKQQILRSDRRTGADTAAPSVRLGNDDLWENLWFPKNRVS